MTSPARYSYFDVQHLPATAWKNGGGTTVELACWPRGASLENFDARVSIARVDRSGPFSVFPGIDRTILLLEGAGLHLRARDGSIDHSLETAWLPFAFRGEAEIDCLVLGGSTRDFNVMTRRSALQASVSVLHAQATLPASTFGLLFAVEGCWDLEIGAECPALQRETGVAWHEPAQSCTLRPRTGTAQPVLICVLLRSASQTSASPL